MARTGAEGMAGLAAILLLVSACGSLPPPVRAPDMTGDDPVEMALSRWTAVRGPVSTDCAERVAALPFTWVSMAETAKHCNLTGEVYGCTDGKTVWLNDDSDTLDATHELIHVLDFCEHGTMESHTDKALWRGLHRDFEGGHW